MQFPRMQVQGLLRPSLSMVDTTSTADSSTREDSDYKRDSKASLKTASKPPKQPVEKSMVHCIGRRYILLLIFPPSS